MKTGLNFVTTTIINSNLDPDSGKKLFNVVKSGKIDGKTVDYIHILRDFVFVKENIQKVYKALGYEAEYATAEIDFTTLVDTLKPKSGVNYCRLDMYLKVEGAEPCIYSTPWVQKGKPFWCEFIVKATDTALTVAKRLEQTINSNHIFQIDKDQVVVKATGAKLTFTSKADFLRFSKIEIHTFSETDEYAEVAAEVDGTTINITKRGKMPFGTYSQIVKDLRLPTVENTNWLHLRKAETPIVGAVYDQYIIEYCAPANNRPLGAVGCETTSQTTHVFWVKHDVATEFEDMFKDKTGLNLAITTVSDDGTTSDAVPVANKDGKAVVDELKTTTKTK